MISLCQVDMFLKYIDDTYFDGEMDLDSKEMLKANMDNDNNGDDPDVIDCSRKRVVFM